MSFFVFLLLVLQILVSSEEEAGMVPPEGDVESIEEMIEAGEEIFDSEEIPVVDGAEKNSGDDEEMIGNEEELVGDDDGLDEVEGRHYDVDLDDLDETELAELLDNLYDQHEPYDDGYGEVAVGSEYEDAAVYMDGEETATADGFEYEIAYNPEDWEEAEGDEGEWELDESFDLEISEGDLLSIDYCEHFTALEDGAHKMNPDRCGEVESAFCDCEVRPDFYYTPEQCLMLKYQFSFDYLMQDCCLDEEVENNLCSDYMEALALCECHPDEGECTEDEMMEDCDYLWDETMHMCRNITAEASWPLCEEDRMQKDNDKTDLRL